MRILLVGHKNWAGRWTESTTAALTNLGHTVRVFHYQDGGLSFRNRALGRMSRLIPPIRSLRDRWARINDKLLETAESMAPDLVLVLKGETIQKQTWQAIKQGNSLLATWWVDNPFALDEAVKGFTHFDALFVFDSAYIPKLRALGIPHVEFLPCAYAADVFYPTHLTELESTRYSCDIAFVGTYFPPREQLFSGLQGVTIGVWGPGGWKRRPEIRKHIDIDRAYRGLVLTPPEAAKVYNSTAVCLNLNHSQSVFDGLNQRGFEIPACRGFQLVDYRAGFESLFEANKEIVYYNSFDEIQDLARYYLSHSDERQRIAQRGYERAVREHSFEHRMAKVLSWAESQR